MRLQPILIALLLVAHSIISFGQSKLNVGIQLQAGSSDRGFDEVSSFTYGFEAFGMYDITPFLAVRAGLGYSLNPVALGPEDAEISGGLSVVPVRVGLELHAPNDVVVPYIALEASYYSLGAYGDVEVAEGSTSFSGYSASFGFRLPIAGPVRIELGGRYNALFNDEGEKGVDFNYYSFTTGLVVSL